jgi:hypothetical protein
MSKTGQQPITDVPPEVAVVLKSPRAIARRRRKDARRRFWRQYRRSKMGMAGLLVLYFLLQRWFVESIERSGITGE